MTQAGPCATLDPPLPRDVAGEERRTVTRATTALMSGPILTGVLGVAFWWVAARSLPSADVGVVAAAVTGIGLVATLAHGNLGAALARFVAPGVSGQRRLLLGSGLLTALIGVGLGGVGLLVAGRDPRVPLFHVFEWWLVLPALAVWTWFVLLDSLLPAVGVPGAVPMVNAGFGLLKLVLLVGLVSVGLDSARFLFLAWLVALVAVTGWAVWVLLRRARPGPSDIRLRELSRFTAWDSGGAMAAEVASFGLPVLVVALFGPSAGAHFYLAWVIATALELMAHGAGTAVTVHRVRSGGQTRWLMHRVVGALAAGTVLAMVLAGPLLGVFGAEYTAAAAILRWLALGALVRAAVVLALAVLRADGRAHALTTVEVIGTTAVMAAAVAGSQVAGVPGVAIGYLVGQCLALGTALVLLRGSAVARRLARRLGTPATGLALVAVGGFVLGVSAVLVTRPGDIGPYGLVEALPWAYFVALAVLTVGFVVFLVRHAASPAWLGVLYVVVLVVLMDGAPALVEGTPRFPVSFVHIGFVQQVMDTGRLLPFLDARFSWPGFFTGSAYLLDAGPAGAVSTAALWFPLVARFAWLTALWPILCSLRLPPQARWLAVWLFCLLEWTGQSYFSPQAVGYFLFLVVLGVLLRYFDAGAADPRVRVPAMLVVLVASAAVVVSHQLTPFMMMAVVGALGVLGLSSARTLWVPMLIMFLAWLSFAAVEYWVGHWTNLIGDAGNMSGSVGSGVEGRIRGSAAHEMVVRSRMALSAAAAGLAGLGVLVAWRRHTLDPRVLVIAAVPFGSLLIQSYDGEGVIRAFLFSLPGAAAMGAVLFTGWRHPWVRRWWAGVALTGVLLALVGPALVAKYGGESYERTDRSELAAAAWLHDRTRSGDMVATVAPAGFLRTRRLEDVSYVPALDEFQTASLPGVTALLSGREKGDGYLFVSRSQATYGTEVSGLRPGWFRRLLRQLSASPDYRLRHRVGSTRIYEYVGQGTS